jgi:hypothetical protein
VGAVLTCPLITRHTCTCLLRVLHVNVLTLLLLLLLLLVVAPLMFRVTSCSDVNGRRRCRHCCRSVLGPQYVGARRGDSRGGQVLLTQVGGCVGGSCHGRQHGPWSLLLLLGAWAS